MAGSRARIRSAQQAKGGMALRRRGPGGARVACQGGPGSPYAESLGIPSRSLGRTVSLKRSYQIQIQIQAPLPPP